MDTRTNKTYNPIEIKKEITIPQTRSSRNRKLYKHIYGEYEDLDNLPIEDNTVRRFVDQSVNVKAMLVSDSQYNKLAGSRVTQEAVLTFKRILPEKGHNGTHLVTVDSTHTETAAVPTTENMTADDKNRTIEAMMVDANNLYNAGKIAEAQALYDKISEINKTLVKN